MAATSGDREAARRRFEEAADLFAHATAAVEGRRARERAVEAAMRRPNGMPAHVATKKDCIPEALLTLREREVLGFVAQGFSNRAIASRLGLSEFTIKRHVSNILGKLDLPTRAAAAAHAARAGLS